MGPGTSVGTAYDPLYGRTDAQFERLHRAGHPPVPVPCARRRSARKGTVRLGPRSGKLYSRHSSRRYVCPARPIRDQACCSDRHFERRADVHADGRHAAVSRCRDHSQRHRSRTARLGAEAHQRVTHGASFGEVLGRGRAASATGVRHRPPRLHESPMERVRTSYLP